MTLSEDAAAATTRAADVICDRHTAGMVDTFMWPADYDTCRPCSRLWHTGPASGILLLPHIDPSWSTAVHEAGHAVIYQEHLGIDVHFASNRPAPQTRHLVGGHVNVNLAPHDVRPVALWAGPLAVRRELLGRGVPSFADLVDVVCNGRDDVAQMRTTGVSDSDLVVLRDEVIGLIDRHWPQISAVAGVLTQQGRLTGAEIRALCGAS